MKVIPFRRGRKEDFRQQLAGRLQSWAHLLRLGAPTGAVMVEMQFFVNNASPRGSAK